ncbi:uncharacterized protein JCM15063_003046 [Sporobolomyces koalae]|uniref:uncharacterized protein n=1 Tax=Sporobolomyces koalae TaxID=500713 RepID=UPI00316C98B1
MPTYEEAGLTFEEHEARQRRAEALPLEICAALRLQNRLHKFGIDDAVFELNQFVLLQSPADQSVRSWTLVGLGFSETRPKPEDSEVDEEAIRNGTSDESWWNKWDQYRLYSSATDVTVRLDDVFDGLARGWGDFEMKRKRLDFLYMNQRPPRARKQQPSRSEETREDQLKLDAMLKDMFE